MCLVFRNRVQQEICVLLPSVLVGLYDLAVAKDLETPIDVPKICARNALDDLKPRVGLDLPKQVQALALVVAVGLANPRLVNGPSGYVDEVVNLVVLEAKLAHGRPYILGLPVVNGIGVVQVFSHPRGPVVPLVGGLVGLFLNREEPMQRLVRANGDQGRRFFARELVRDLRGW